MADKSQKQYTLPQHMRDALEAPLPHGAVTSGGYGKGLSSIKPIYVTERLNDVFGIGGWKFEFSWSNWAEDSNSHFRTFTALQTGKSSKADKYGNKPLPEQVDHITVVGKLKIYAYAFGGERDLEFDTVGGSTNTDIGDMAKGAVSDALTKAAAQYLGVGAYVYKGKSAPAPVKFVPNPAEAVKKTNPGIPCPQCAIEDKSSTMEWIPAGISSKTGKPFDACYLCRTCEFVTRP